MTTSSRLAGVALLSAGLLAFSGCSDSSAPTGGSQGVSFRYAGSLSGLFRAVGPASRALDPARSFAVAFRSAAGELQLCAYQPGTGGGGNFLLLNAGVAASPGEYPVPPEWAPMATGFQPGTFLVDVDAPRTSVAQISTFTRGVVKVDELTATNVRGTFTVTSLLATLTDGRFDVPMDRLANLPVICE